MNKDMLYTVAFDTRECSWLAMTDRGHACHGRTPTEALQGLLDQIAPVSQRTETRFPKSVM